MPGSKFMYDSIPSKLHITRVYTAVFAIRKTATAVLSKVLNFYTSTAVVCILVILNTKVIEYMSIEYSCVHRRRVLEYELRYTPWPCTAVDLDLNLDLNLDLPWY